MDIIVATNNQGKVKEIKNILYPHNVMSQAEIGVDIRLTVGEIGVAMQVCFVKISVFGQ